MWKWWMVYVLAALLVGVFECGVLLGWLVARRTRRNSYHTSGDISGYAACETLRRAADKGAPDVR